MVEEKILLDAGFITIVIVYIIYKTIPVDKSLSQRQFKIKLSDQIVERADELDGNEISEETHLKKRK